MQVVTDALTAAGLLGQPGMAFSTADGKLFEAVPARLLRDCHAETAQLKEAVEMAQQVANDNMRRAAEESEAARNAADALAAANERFNTMRSNKVSSGAELARLRAEVEQLKQTLATERQTMDRLKMRYQASVSKEEADALRGQIEAKTLEMMETRTRLDDVLNLQRENERAANEVVAERNARMASAEAAKAKVVELEAQVEDIRAHSDRSVAQGQTYFNLLQARDATIQSIQTQLNDRMRSAEAKREDIRALEQRLGETQSELDAYVENVRTKVQPAFVESETKRREANELANRYRMERDATRAELAALVIKSEQYEKAIANARKIQALMAQTRDQSAADRERFEATLADLRGKLERNNAIIDDLTRDNTRLATDVDRIREERARFRVEAEQHLDEVKGLRLMLHMRNADIAALNERQQPIEPVQAVPAPVGLRARPKDTDVFSFKPASYPEEVYLRINDVNCGADEVALTFTPRRVHRANCGTYGCTYICEQNGIKVAVKLGAIRQNEVDQCTLAGQKGVSPAVLSFGTVRQANKTNGEYRINGKKVPMFRMVAVGPKTLATMLHENATNVIPVYRDLMTRLTNSGLIHGDLKADNVMVDESSPGVAKKAWAIDWGVYIVPTDANIRAMRILQFLVVLSWWANNVVKRVFGQEYKYCVLVSMIRAKQTAADRETLSLLYARLKMDYTTELGLMQAADKVMHVQWGDGAVPQEVPMPDPSMISMPSR